MSQNDIFTRLPAKKKEQQRTCSSGNFLEIAVLQSPKGNQISFAGQLRYLIREA